MKKVITIYTVLFLLGCTGEEKTIINEHINLIITPDLSNRIEGLYPKPVTDVELITNIYSNYYPDIYNIKNRIIGQKDILQIRFTNPSIISDFNINLNSLTMDLSVMNPDERINYLAKDGNKAMLKALETEVKNIYLNAKQNSTGGDIYNYFKKEITPTVIKKSAQTLEIDEFTKVTNIQRNIIVLLTDGYIEAGLYGNKNCLNKKCLFLSKTKIDQFRNEFLKSGNNDLEDFFKSSGYGIIPIKNKILESTEVFVSEMYDRSLNPKTGSQTVSPNDFEIMVLFWSDWLEKSGVKHYRLLDTANSKEEFLTELKNFISEK
jgi:hypothetical protein